MRPELTLALKRMGYRHMGKGVWGKPVAYHLFTVHMVKNCAVFTNHFLGADHKPLVYETHTITNVEDYGGYERGIKFVEYSTRTDVGSLGFDSDYGFITQEELFAGML